MRAPVLAVGDGALGLWNALGQGWPATAHQRCWVHVIARVLSTLPKGLHPRAKQLLRGICYAESRTKALAAAKAFADELAGHPKAGAKVMDDLEVLLTFFDVPAEHFKHLRTTDPIESPFATVLFRTKVTKGAGSRAAAVVMGYKLLAAAEERWRRVDGPQLVALVRAGKLVERDDTHNEEDNRDQTDEKRAA